MPTPATNTSAAMGDSFSLSGRALRGAEVERDHVVSLLVLLAHARRHLHRHPEPDRLGLGLDVDDVAAHRHALRQIDHPDDVGTGTPGKDWCTIEYTHSVPLRDSGTSSNGPRPAHLLHAIRSPRYTAPQAVQRVPTRYGSPSSGRRRNGTMGRRPVATGA